MIHHNHQDKKFHMAKKINMLVSQMRKVRTSKQIGTRRSKINLKQSFTSTIFFNKKNNCGCFLLFEAFTFFP